MATVKFVRLRAGFYVTRDAQWRIVRRSLGIRGLWVWHVEQWNPRTRAYERITTKGRYTDARQHVLWALAPVVEES